MNELLAPEELNLYEPIYSLDKKGNVRVYKQELSMQEDHILLTYSSGIVNKKLTTSFCKISKPKGKRTLVQQANLEANSTFNDKKLEGYKSVLDLVAKSYAEDIMIDFSDLDIHDDEKAIILFRELKLKYNTNEAWLPLPMLASKWKDIKKKVKYPVAIQPKLNGVRCLAMYDKDSNEVILASRGGKQYNVPHIKMQLESYFILNQTLILDGELYFHGKPLQTISGEVRKENQCADWVEYHMYDIFDTKKKQSDRLNDLRIHGLILRGQYDAKSVFVVNHYLANDEEDVKKYHDDFVSEGYEGAITRDFEGLYEASFRSSFLGKVKAFEDEEFELLGCEVDKDKTIGDSFVFILKNNIDDQIFKARPTGTIQQKLAWHQDQSWIGKKATVRFQERSTGGLPIQGHVRHSDSKAFLEMEVIRDYE